VLLEFYTGGIVLNKYDDYRIRLIEYFNNGSKEQCKYIGTEFEHFIINKTTLESYNYFQEDGIGTILNKLSLMGWEIIAKEKEHILGLKKYGSTITLEPGGQVELSLRTFTEIKEIDQLYRKIIEEINSVLTKEQIIVSLGYHPATKISDIPFLPKERYTYMSGYLEKKGKYAHNMMKGTASTQVSIDYDSEEDFTKKFRVANFLSPFISRIFDASPIFEGDILDGENLRIDIWKNTDNDRSKIVPNSMSKSFDYGDYADYILNTPPILVQHGGEVYFTEAQIFSDLIKEYDFNQTELEHITSMVFPDVRVKQYIEIRMADAIPYPLNMAIPALIKGIFYNEDNLEKYYQLSQKFSDEDVEKIKTLLLKQLDFDYKGINIFEFASMLIEDAKSVLANGEADYISTVMEYFGKSSSYSNELKALYKEDKMKFLEAISVEVG